MYIFGDDASLTIVGLGHQAENEILFYVPNL